MFDMRGDVGMGFAAQHADAGQMRLGALAFQHDVQFRCATACAPKLAKWAR